MVMRIMAAVIMPILDCDETFNYWEPLHFLMSVQLRVLARASFVVEILAYLHLHVNAKVRLWLPDMGIRASVWTAVGFENCW